MILVVTGSGSLESSFRVKPVATRRRVAERVTFEKLFCGSEKVVRLGKRQALSPLYFSFSSINLEDVQANLTS